MLTIAIWSLCLLVLIQLAFYLPGFISSWGFLRGSGPYEEVVGESVGLPGSPAGVTGGKPFHDLPPEEKVAQSSVILLTEYRSEGGKLKAVVTEILKRTPGTKLYYSIGEEFATLSRYPREGEVCGDGQVVFLVGSPASMRSAYSYTDGRIGGLGDMPLTTLRDMVAQAKP